MNSYLNLLNDVLSHGVERKDRTGTGTIGVFGRTLRINLDRGFPLLTTKQINYRAVFNEFLWMVVNGSTDVDWLRERGHHFWDAWEKEDGTIGPGYGKQFRDVEVIRGLGGTHWRDHYDQVKNVIDGIRKDPYSRRHIISLWNVGDIDAMALPPCHGLVTQFHVEPSCLGSDGPYLNCATYQRSADVFLGLAWNIPFYALFTHVVAALTGCKVGELIYNIGDCHIYSNHVEQVKEQLGRRPLQLPTLGIAPPASMKIDDITMDNIVLHHYKHHPAIKAPVAV